MQRIANLLLMVVLVFFSSASFAEEQVPDNYLFGIWPGKTTINQAVETVKVLENKLKVKFPQTQMKAGGYMWVDDNHRDDGRHILDVKYCLDGDKCITRVELYLVAYPLSEGGAITSVNKKIVGISPKEYDELKEQLVKTLGTPMEDYINREYVDAIKTPGARLRNKWPFDNGVVFIIYTANSHNRDDPPGLQVLNVSADGPNRRTMDAELNRRRAFGTRARSR